MSATELEVSKTEKAEEQVPETLAERVERELGALRDTGILKKALPTITMSTFNQLPPRSQMDFIKGGGKLCDDPAPEKKPLPKDAKTRGWFEALSHSAKMDFIKSGGSLVDEADYLPSATKSSTVITRADFRELRMSEAAAFLDAGGTITD